MQIQTATRVVDFQRERAIRLWKTGKTGEARDILLGLLSEPFSLSLDDKLKLASNLAIVERDAGRLDEALSVMLKASPLAEVTRDYELRGIFHNTLAGLYYCQKQFDKAFIELTAAAYAHEQAGNIKLCADIENNIGNLLIEAGVPQDAHKHLNRSARLFETLDAHTSIAQVNDSRARAHLSEGNVDRALDCILEAVTYLRTAGEPRLLIESLGTLAEVSRAKRIHDALVVSNGSITHAARLLGIPHNTSLNHLLKTKYPQFKHLRKPETHSRRKK
jgi:tetratricopeptide (TPR) repeat protein